MRRVPARTWESERRRAPDVDLVLDIARPPAEVRAWWLEMPDDYRASDPKEQPHRIVTVRREKDLWEADTHWRGPPWGDIVVRETFHLREDGWDVDVKLPFGLAQRDVFVLSPTPTGTRVRIRAWIWAPTLASALALPAMRAYAKRSYPRTWGAARRLCERDAPRLG